MCPLTLFLQKITNEIIKLPVASPKFRTEMGGRKERGCILVLFLWYLNDIDQRQRLKIVTLFGYYDSRIIV